MIEGLMVVTFTREEGKEYGAEKAAILENIRVAGGEITVEEIVHDLSYAIPKKKIFKHLKKLEKYGLVRDNGEGIITLE